jgi:hypothetical protein
MVTAKQSEKARRKEIARSKMFELDLDSADSIDKHIFQELIALRRQYTVLTKYKPSRVESFETQPVSIAIDALNLWRVLSARTITWAFKDHIQRSMKVGKFVQTFTKTEDQLASETVEDALMFALGEEGEMVYLALPRVVAEKLYYALGELPSGEIQSIIRPTTKPTTKPISRNYQFRFLAVEAVAYLQGRGEKKAAAEAAVGKAFGVGGETIRKWEQYLRKKNPTLDLDAAFVAGTTDKGVSKDVAQREHATWRRRGSSRKAIESGVAPAFAAAWARRSRFGELGSVANFAEIGRHYQELNWKHLEAGW